MPRKKPDIDYIYLEIIKNNPTAYKRYLLFVHRKFWYSTLWWVSDGTHNTKNSKEAYNDQNS